MTIREKVARAICNAETIKDRGDWVQHKDCSAEATAAINAFLKAAAEDGWRMRPDEATDEMIIADCELDCGYACCHNALGGPKCVNHGGRRRYSAESWEKFLDTAPEFVWEV